MLLSRRQLLVHALQGGALLAGAPALALAETSMASRFLTEADQLILAAVVPVILAGALPVEGRKAAIEGVIRDLDSAIAHLPERTRDELRQLFELLDGRLSRLALTGLWAQWAELRPAQVEEFLGEWRESYLDLLRTAYAGLHDLILGVWYGTPAAWSGIGYGGPPPILD
ncbi:MAG: hypothetical protein HYV16_16665 [Gammaproteobacteria bacterium]|nr:hypothetical protein [Gammaproteobacteria bacterium]